AGAKGLRCSALATGQLETGGAVDEAKPFRQRPNIGSRVTREGHARFWERPEVKFLRATRQLLRALLHEVPVGLYAVVVRCSFATQFCGSAGGKELGPYGHRCREGY